MTKGRRQARRARPQEKRETSGIYHCVICGLHFKEMKVAQQTEHRVLCLKKDKAQKVAAEDKAEKAAGENKKKKKTGKNF